MSLRAVLSHGCILAEDEKERQIMAPYPPLGLLYVAAYLERAGVEVEVLDPTLGTRAQLEQELAVKPPGVLGLYVTFMTRSSVLRIAAVAAGLGWIVVVGGPDGAAHAEQYLAHAVHVVVVGEGEQTMLELLEVIDARGRDAVHQLHEVPGTVFLDARDQVVRGRPRELVADLDSLPWPAREKVDVPAYLEAWREHHGAGPVSLITSRGCAYRCDWCSHAVFGRSHRRRSPAACADEAEWILETYHPDRLWYADDVFTIHHGWLRRYAAELGRRGIDAPFETITRADRLLEPEIARALAAMGCERLWIGAESGSARLLEAMGRGVSPEQVIRAAELARAQGIEVGLFLMWGYQGEQLADIEATVDMVCRVRPEIFLTTVVYPIKGTGYWDKVRDLIENPLPWAESSDRDNQVRGRPGREHYRLADSFLKTSMARARADDPEEAVALAAEVAAVRARLLEARQRLGLEG